MDELPIRLGTRSSPLARWQAEWVSAQLRQSGALVELVPITTQGDVKSGPIGSLGGQGLFTKEIQRALLESRVDIAVHSLKDLPTEPISGLALGAVPEREQVDDALITRGGLELDQLSEGATVGTGSLRRRAMLLHHRSDLRMREIRGNVGTRLGRLDDGEYDAIILAVAGLKRLNLAARITQVLSSEIIFPAVGQGALGIECREGDSRILGWLESMNHAPTRASVLAERAMLASLRGGCLAPVGALGRCVGGELSLEGVVLDGQGTRRLHVAATGPPEDAEALGQEVARQLLDQGAAQLIDDARGS